MRRLTLEEARRIAVRAQLLDADRPRDLPAVVDRLTFLQLDPTAAIAPSADLVAWTRLGNSYQPAHVRQALDTSTMFEHRSQPVKPSRVGAMVRPMADRGLHLADIAAWPVAGSRALEWLSANDGVRRRVVGLMATSCPPPCRAIPDSGELPWASTGWTNHRNVTQMLEFLAHAVSRPRRASRPATRRDRRRFRPVASRPGTDETAARCALVQRTPTAGWLRATGTIQGTRGTRLR